MNEIKKLCNHKVVEYILYGAWLNMEILIPQFHSFKYTESWMKNWIWMDTRIKHYYVDCTVDISYCANIGEAD